MDGKTDEPTENRTPISHFAKAGAIKKTEIVSIANKSNIESTNDLGS